MGVIETTTEYIVVRMATRWSGKSPIEPLTLPKVGGSSRWSATSRNPLSQQLCFLIGGQPNSLGDIFVARQKPPSMRDPCTLKSLRWGGRGLHSAHPGDCQAKTERSEKWCGAFRPGPLGRGIARRPEGS